MYCPNCNHSYDGGKFCENCGSPLDAGKEGAATVSNASSGIPQQNTTQTRPNEQLEAAKNISKMYFNYFLTVLKKPYAITQEVGKEQFVNGIITIVLYALFIPLMLYFSLGDLKSYMDSAFLNIVLKPTIAYAIFILLIGVFIFLAVRLGNIQASIQDVIAKFGTALIPFVGLFIVALILSVLQATFISMILLVLGFFLSIFSVPGLVIASFKKDSKQGLDPIYGTVLTYVLTIIVIMIMSEMLFSNIARVIGDSFWFF